MIIELIINNALSNFIASHKAFVCINELALRIVIGIVIAGDQHATVAHVGGFVRHDITNTILIPDHIQLACRVVHDLLGTRNLVAIKNVLTDQRYENLA